MRKTTFSLLLLSAFFLQYCGNAAQLEEQVQLLQEELEVKESMVDSLQQIADAEPGFIHTVFFWFNEGVNEEQKNDFIEGLNTLKDVETVREFYIGPPAGTPREVVDNSYDYALILHFDDKAGQDTYQDHPIHQAFVQAQEGVWERVQVYDTLVE